MFDIYRNLVRGSYMEKLNEAKLSVNLSAPSPAKIKRECLRIYIERDHPDDRKVLSDFFGTADESGRYESIIRGFDIDRFRPLVNFLRRPTHIPDGKNVELLAWLIDYQPRPFRFDTFAPPAVDKPTNPAPLPTTMPDPEPPKEPAPPLIPWWKKRNIRIAVMAFCAAMATMGIFSIWPVMHPAEQCMYWKEDHYEPIDCGQRVYGKEIIAMDTSRINHFALVTQPDTLTPFSENKFWYTKINNVPQCFTAPGRHPLYKDRQLKPLSLLIIKKYFNHQQLY